MIQFWRILKFALIDFWRNIWVSVNTITIITLSLLSVNFLIVVTILVNQAIISVEDRVNINIYFKKDVSITEVEALQKRIDNDNKITLKSAEVISPENALENFRIRYANDTDITNALNELEENPFSYSLLLQTENLNEYTEIATILKEPAYTTIIEEQDFSNLESHDKAIARVNDISNKVRDFGLIVTLVLVFNSLLVVLNTIRLNIYTHKDEIVIMRLVGASTFMIRGPFIIESVLYAVFSLLLTSGIVYPGLSFLQGFLPQLLGQPNFNITEYLLANWDVYIIWQILSVTLLTVFASTIAMRRYLRE